MPRFIAFLRAINVGGHTVKMDRLRQLFESFSFSNVETFIASGNVVFEAASNTPKDIQTKIETGLRDALGYPVATLIRTQVELAEIASYKPFRQADLDAAEALNIAFLGNPPDEPAKQRLMSLKTDIDDFHMHAREVYWLCLKKQSESNFSNALLEKALGQPSTLRGVNTIQKMAAKYCE